MALRDKTSAELFQLYDSDLVLRLHNIKNLRDTRTLLSHFEDFLGERPISPEVAKGFLAKYADRKPRTLYRYAQMIKAFMKWYGEPLDDIKVRVPKTLPSYTEDHDIEKLLDAIGQKKSHKGCIIRDRLIVEVAWRTGMRRAELAGLKKKDIHTDSLIVRGGKGNRDRMIPLTQDVTEKLGDFIKDMKPDDKVFGLGAPAISMKVKQFAIKAGLADFHTHTLRHKYATDLLESGANIKVVQALLGHEQLNTTEVYLSITNQSLYDAVKKLDEHKSGAIRDRSQDTTKVYESAIEITMWPVSNGPKYSPIDTRKAASFELDIKANDILIENVQIRSSDPKVPYQLILFEAESPEDPTNWECEDIVHVEQVRQRVFTYSPNAPLPYTDRNGNNQLHGGIIIGQRPFRFDISYKDNEKEWIDYYQAPVQFVITLRYRLISG